MHEGEHNFWHEGLHDFEHNLVHEGEHNFWHEGLHDFEHNMVHERLHGKKQFGAQRSANTKKGIVWRTDLEHEGLPKQNHGSESEHEGTRKVKV